MVNISLSLSTRVSPWSYNKVRHYREGESFLIFTRLFLGILAMVVGMMATATFFINNQAEAMLHEQARQHLHEAASSTLQEARGGVDSIATSLQTFAATYKNSNLSNSEIFSIFTDLATANPTISELQVAYPNGRYLTFPGSPTDEYDPRTTDWYTQALSLGDHPAYVSEVFQYSSTEFPKIAVSLPLYNEDGASAGVVVAFVSVPKLSEFIQQIRIGETGYAMIIDQNGTLVAHPDQSYALQRPSLHDNPAVQEMMTGQTGLTRMAWDGVDQFASYVYDPWLQWGIVVLQNVAEVEQEKQKLQITILTVSLLGVAALAALLYGYIRKIIKPVKEVQEKMTAFSKGDLTQTMHVQSNDELRQLADSFNSMSRQIGSIIDKIQHVMADVKQVALHVGDGSRHSHEIQTEVATASEHLSREIDNQQEQIREIISHVDQITQEIMEIGKRIATAMTRNQESQKQIALSSDSIQQLTEDMGQISEDMQASLGAVSAMKENMNDIRDILGMISEISRQTRLLSLNARIEASRAGQAGLGFAVVADEISVLSERTAAATERIQQVISWGEKRMDHVSETMTATDQATSNAIETLNHSMQVFSQTIQISEEITGQFAEIGQLSHSIQQHSEWIQQRADNLAASADEVMKGMQQTVASNQESLALSEQFRNDAHNLRVIVEDLEQEVRFFQTAHQ